MRLFEGMEVKQNGDDMSVRYLTVVPFFQVSHYMSITILGHLPILT